MGGEPYEYLVDYEADIQSALDRLRQDVFEKGLYRGAELNPSTPQEALELSQESGTASILDIMRISQTPDYCCAAPFNTQELLRYFGTTRPTPDIVEENNIFWEDMERGQARYVILYERDVPRKIWFVGYSFD